MAFTGKTGDRPRFPLTNERLDKPDLTAIADYLNETLVRMLGALLGPSSGALSPVTFDFSTPGQVSITNRCFFAYAWPEVPGDYGTLQGGVVIHDPARQSQPNSLIDLSAAVAGQDAWIWFQRIEVPTHTATRRNWVAGAEATAPALTLLEEGVTFYATTTTAHATINEANGFFKFGAVTAADWAAGAPTSIRVINFPDGGNFATAANLDGGTVTEFGPSASITTGLALQLRWLFAKVSQIMDSDNTFDAASVATTTGAVGWASDPTAGLSQLAAADTAMQADIDLVGERAGVLANMLVVWDSGAGEYRYDSITGKRAIAGTTPFSLATEDITTSGVLPFTYTSGHRAKISVGLPSGYLVMAVYVTPLKGSPSAGPADITVEGGYVLVPVVKYGTALPHTSGITRDYYVELWDTVYAAGQPQPAPRDGDFSFTVIGYKE